MDGFGPTDTDPDDEEPTLERSLAQLPGPALLYRPSGLPGMPLLFRVDTSRITGSGSLSLGDARRERMLLRALLNHALFLLGPEEAEE